MFEKILSFFGLATKNQMNTQVQSYKKRAVYAAAQIGNFYGNWSGSDLSGNSILYSDLVKMRQRSRDLVRSNELGAKASGMWQNNVIGSGIKLQMRIYQDKDNKIPDKVANDRIEQAWKDWGQKWNCDISNKFNFVKMQQLAAKHIFDDGEVLIRKYRGTDSKYGYQLQLLEADHLDDKYNDLHYKNGNKIKMGKEYDSFGRVVAYHLFKEHPGDNYFASMQRGERERVSAADIIHLFIPERISQDRGIPVMHAAMNKIHMIGGAEEGALVAIRIAAAKMGFYEQSEDATPTDAITLADETDDDDLPVQHAVPGTFELLPKGLKLSSWAPEFPNNIFEPLMNHFTKSAASGINVSYAKLANDFEGATWSSLRAGEMDEKDAWKIIQAWFIMEFLSLIFPEWLRFAIISGEIDLPMSKFDKFNKPSFMPRGFKWVSPKDEAITNGLLYAMRLKSLSKIAAESDEGDLEDIAQQIAKDRQILESYGIENIDDVKIAEIISMIDSNENDGNSNNNSGANKKTAKSSVLHVGANGGSQGGKN